VCDFGLSQVKLPETVIRDGKSIPGTPLWMAPEVLLGKDVDEKSDVYSYGIVLWEILTGKEPFPHMDSYGTFKRAITKEHDRPEIPPETHPSLKSLMETCWQPDPTKRPPFTKILLIWDSVVEDCLVSDSVGCQFWKDNFLGKDHVPWGDFQNAFYKLLKLPTPKNATDLNVQCLKKILADESKDPDAKDAHQVSLEKFGHLCNWFGPIVIDHKGFSILDKLKAVMQKEWFHGFITKEVAEDLLAGQAKGTFLVRTSKTERESPFTISKVNKKGELTHQRIHKAPDGSFEMAIKFTGQKPSKTMTSKDDLLVPFIRSVTTELHLDIACPGSIYRSIFNPAKVQGYLSNDF